MQVQPLTNNDRNKRSNPEYVSGLDLYNVCSVTLVKYELPSSNDCYPIQTVHEESNSSTLMAPIIHSL